MDIDGMNKHRLETILCVLVMGLISGCDSVEADLSREQVEFQLGDSLTVLSDYTLSNGTVQARVRRGNYIYSIYEAEELGQKTGGGGSLTGLWMATNTPTFEANLGTFIPNGINGFATVSGDSLEKGFFIITADSVDGPIDNWPTHLGAPTESARIPKLYGDRMLWMAQQTEQESYPNSASIEDVAVGVTLFAFDSGPLVNVMFVRYDVTNKGTESIDNLHLGFGSDLDIFRQGRGVENQCRSLWVDHNSSGYDLDRDISYVYVKPGLPGEYTDECFGLVAGFSILSMQSDHGLDQPKLAHRIWRERSYLEYGVFSETLMDTPEHVFLAMNGLAYDGTAMFDSTLNRETKFAFPGNPVTGTGWLDVRHDGRALQSIEPFDLQVGDTRSMTVAFMISRGPNLEQGLRGLKETYDQVLQNRASWDY